MITPSNLVSDKSPFRSLLHITVNVILGFVILGPLIGLAVSSAFYDGDLLQDLQSSTMKPGFAMAMLIMQGVVTFVGLILLPLIHVTQLEHKKLKPFFPDQRNIVTLILVVACIAVTFPISISPLAEWNLNLKFPEFLSKFEEWALNEEERLAKLTEAITDFKSVPDMLLGMVIIGLLPAIGEELVFRGMIQNELWRGTNNPHLAIWISAAIFSAIHIQFYGFVPRLLLGAMFGYLYYWSGSLLIPILSHFFNNAFAVLMVYLNQIEVVTIDIESGESAPWSIVSIGLIITVGLLYYLWKHYDELRAAGRNNSLQDNSPLV
jgi:membrane protease YdiL (CAAX protease family)